jgi:hypothetical protein
MDSELAKTYAWMIKVTYIIVVGLLIYFFMPASAQQWFMDKLLWFWSNTGGKVAEKIGL